ncbi:MAG: hypothetical protein K8F54_08380 [Altibacter sp.]|uniref:hypothetical protein n=1 Tax=Altibacter sp. TaxID=2024823 RepID=UPI001DCB9141|nr:hypothetical protein [Altibacter sp.]MBZ0327603.1 hypothetical protein [Altibacter sp.]
MMKNLALITLFALLLVFSSTRLLAQSIPQYDYIEVIVIQKANNRGKVKRIKVEEQASLEGKSITIDEIEDIKDTSALLRYMNEANWEFLERQAVVSEDNDPVWMSYIFRKAK